MYKHFIAILPYGYLESFGLADYIKKINLDEIMIFFGSQKYENCFMINCNLPGFSKILDDNTINKDLTIYQN